MNDESVFRKNIGKKIKLARTRSRFTQEKLAEKVSLSTRYISQLERGLAFGSASTIINICKALNINSDFLFSDLIETDAPCLTDLVNEKFLEEYLKLDDRNRTVIELLTSQLLKLQSDDNNNESGNSKIVS